MATHPSSRGLGTEVICPRRLATLNVAVELQVDPDEVRFESEAERELWEELREEFEALVAKIGPVWIAD
jgi:hypothetical protein